jgi:hypothetical protein
LNNSDNIVLQPQDVKTWDESGTSVVTYKIKLVDAKSPAEGQIAINKHSSPIADSLEYTAESVGKIFRILYPNAKVDYRNIDSKPGYDVSAINHEGRSDIQHQTA